MMKAEEKLQAAMEFVQLVAKGWYVDERWHKECFFCYEKVTGPIKLHKVDCPVLRAQALLVDEDGYAKQIARMTVQNVIERVQTEKRNNQRPEGLREVWDTAYGHMLVFLDEELQKYQ